MTTDQRLIQTLLDMNLIHRDFVGSVTLHISVGPALCDAETRETSILQRAKKRAEKNSLDRQLRVMTR